MVLLPRQVRLFAWEDPTGTRKLKWSYAENVGEHDLLKVSSDVNGYHMKCAVLSRSVVFDSLRPY